MHKARLGLLVFGIGLSEESVREPIALSKDLQEVIGPEVASRFEQLL